MKIVEAKNARVEKESRDIFIGTVESTRLIDASTGSKEFTAEIITFPPGTRNKLHVHDHEQILYVTNGKGIVATEKEERVVTVGDVIFFPAGERHWHGATKDSTFSHLYVLRAETKTTISS